MPTQATATIDSHLCMNVYMILSRYAYPWWKEKETDSENKRKAGLCPLTPEEVALVLQALDIDPKIQICIAAGDTYGGERRTASLRAAFPNLVRPLVQLE